MTAVGEVRYERRRNGMIQSFFSVVVEAVFIDIITTLGLILTGGGQLSTD